MSTQPIARPAPVAVPPEALRRIEDGVAELLLEAEERCLRDGLSLPPLPGAATP